MPINYNFTGPNAPQGPRAPAADPDLEGLKALLSGSRANDPTTLAGLRDQRKSELEDQLANQAVQPPSVSGFGAQGGAGEKTIPNVPNPNLGNTGRYSALLGTLQGDIANDPYTGAAAKATTTENDELNRLATLHGFGSPQEAAAYPRIQAAKAAASAQALEEAKTREAIAQGEYYRNVGIGAEKRGEAALMQAGNLPGMVGKQVELEHADLMKQYYALPTEASGTGAVSNFLAPMFGGKTLEMKKQDLVSQINLKRTQMDPLHYRIPLLTGKEITGPNVTPPPLPASPTTTGGNFNVTSPSGKVHSFATQEDANEFKQAIGVR